MTRTAARGWAVAWTLATAALLLVRLPAPIDELAGGWLPELPYDKLAHVVVFAVLAWAWLVAVEAPAGWSAAAWIVIGAAVLYGGALEVAQYLVGGRSAEWLDLAADALGATLAPAVRDRAPSGSDRGAPLT